MIVKKSLLQAIADDLSGAVRGTRTDSILGRAGVLFVRLFQLFLLVNAGISIFQFYFLGGIICIALAWGLGWILKNRPYWIGFERNNS